MNPLVQSCSHSRKSYDRYMTGNSPIKLGSETLLLHFLGYLSHRNNPSPTTHNKKEKC